MNAKRMASIARQMSALWAEYADALEEQEPKRTRKPSALPEPKAPPTPEALDRMSRAMRRSGVAA